MKETIAKVREKIEEIKQALDDNKCPVKGMYFILQDLSDKLKGI